MLYLQYNRKCEEVFSFFSAQINKQENITCLNNNSINIFRLYK
jgi:hypothetical protein